VNSSQPPRRSRRRGVVLTPQGLEKLRTIKTEHEYEKNQGRRYTLEDLAEITGLAVDTIMKIQAAEAAVDKQSLKNYARAFDVMLEARDYGFPEDIRAAHEETLPAITEEANPLASVTLSTPLPINGSISDTNRVLLPGSQVPLGSAFYVERVPNEITGCEAVVQSGALIRIKGARKSGKSSLMARILAHASQHQCLTCTLDLDLAEKNTFEDLDKFLKWFCGSVGVSLQRPRPTEDDWDDFFGSKMNCKLYFERYILSQSDQPLALGLDNVDRLFEYPELADEFFALLRAWHEEARNGGLWQKLRLLVAHSAEIYIQINLNRSPFNVGLPIELNNFTLAQLQTLNSAYSLDLQPEQLTDLLALTGGHPFLVQTAFYHLHQQQVPWEQLVSEATTNAGIYSAYLQSQLWKLQQQPELLNAYRGVLNTHGWCEMDMTTAFKLKSMGFVELNDLMAKSSCMLYEQYFQRHL
jgi:transcriptional regulator with XRE-family HTH domain